MTCAVVNFAPQAPACLTAAPLTPEECHAAGMTVAQAARASGIGRGQLYRWAERNGVTFAHPPVRFEAAPLSDLDLVDPDPVLCRALWAAVLADQWTVVFNPTLTDDKARREALVWFGSSDCATVCNLAGVEFDFVMRRLRAALAQATPPARVFRRKVSK